MIGPHAAGGRWLDQFLGALRLDRFLRALRLDRWLLRTQGSDPVARPAATGPAVAGARSTTAGRLPGVDPNLLVAQAYEAFQREIHAFALHATRDADAAADVTQEVFLRLLREVSARDAPANVRAWCYRVAANLVVSQARRVSVAERWRRIVSGPEVVEDSPERSLMDRERDASVQSALAELPKDARAALLMAAHGFSGREIADAIGRTELATRTLLCRARTQLRTQLAGWEGQR